MTEEQEELTMNQFISRISLESLHVYPEGEFEVYYHDGDLFWGHVIIVKGNINGTFHDAHIQAKGWRNNPWKSKLFKN
ncbi:hypothetical protein BSAF29S_02503 [Bacillus safensis subsp. safensis]